MKALYEFVVRKKELFNESFEHGSLKLAKDPRWIDDNFRERVPYGEILETPAKHPELAKFKGGLLVHHHHVNLEDKYSVGEDTYLVTYDPYELSGHAFAVIMPDGEVHMLGDWVFLSAPEDVEKEEQQSSSGLFLGYEKKDDKDTEAELYCESQTTEELGIRVGDKIGFENKAAYRIKLPNGDEVFRMKPRFMLYVRD